MRPQRATEVKRLARSALAWDRLFCLVRSQKPATTGFEASGSRRQAAPAARVFQADNRFHPRVACLVIFILLLIPAKAMACISCEFDPFTVWDAATPKQELTISQNAALWLIKAQQNLHQHLMAALNGLRSQPSAHAVWGLIIAGFLYGVLHAAGPGHGKAVISAYLLTHREDWLRGIGLSAAAALLQGLTAIVIVLLMIGALGLMTGDTMAQVRHVEVLSFVLIAVLGVWLCVRALRLAWSLRRQRQEKAFVLATPTEQHPPFPGINQQKSVKRPVFPTTGPDCGCSGVHHVSPDGRGPWVAAVLAVGLRPCTGAVLVMSVSAMLGIWLAGVVSVLAMSIGTAITVSLIALLAVQARGWTRHRFLRAGYTRRMRYAEAATGFAGGVAILLVGLTLLQGTLSLEYPQYLPGM
jgi:nickel/cobalt exporter